jgi:uncharacterized protein YdiU (UPF0061 family)
LFRRLCLFSAAPEASNEAIRDLFIDRTGFDRWAQDYKARLALDPGGLGPAQDETRALRMRQVNPWVVLRNHLAQTAIEAAQALDFSEIERLLQVLFHPFDEAVPGIEAHHLARYAGFPPDWAQQLQVSCSS